MNKKIIYSITEFLARASPLLCIVVIIKKLHILDCIPIIDKVWMIIVLIAIFSYSINKYWDAAR